jgi:spore coat protein U-like protein
VARFLLNLLFLSLFPVAFGGPEAEAQTLTVAATVLSKNVCKFNSKTSTLAFGSLDPANPVDVTVSTSIIFSCKGASAVASFFIDDDDGLYETGVNANRMRHATLPTEFLPYSLTLSPASGTAPKNVDQTLTITGLAKGVDYQNAAAGSYADTVVISIVP